MVLFYLKYFCLQVKFQLAFSLSTKKRSVLKITVILFWQDILRVFKPLTLHLFPHTPQAIYHHLQLQLQFHLQILTIIILELLIYISQVYHLILELLILISR